MPPIGPAGLWPAQITAILFLVDRKTLGSQTLKECQNFAVPDDGRKFAEIYVTQLLSSNQIDPVAKVAITTIQRLYSMLVGRELPCEEEDERSAATWDNLTALPDPIEYNPSIPIETFDFIVTDECHRSIYNLWRQVLEYFDASIIGLTAAPSRQTMGFFNQNLVMEYNHHRAVEDRVNVDYDVYEIRTQITQSGSTVNSGFYVEKRDRLTRARRAELLDQNLTYSASDLDRSVVAIDQIRTVIREEFGKGNDSCQKVTYRTGTRCVRRKVVAEDGTETEIVTWEPDGNDKPETVISLFRNRYYPRIAVTVDMIAAGTDIKPLEIVMFLRDVRRPNLFEQMKGRGVRVISPDDLMSVTPTGGDSELSPTALLFCLTNATLVRVASHGRSDAVSRAQADLWGKGVSCCDRKHRPRISS